MTIEEAFEEIGLAPGSGPGEIRRGYLRKLKTRKPEVDPEGFRRLREAYERLSDLVREEEPYVAPPVPFSAPPAPAPAPAPAAVQTSPVMPEPEPEPQPEPQPAAPLSPESVFVHLLELHAGGALAEAAAVEARFRERLHASGQELRLLDADLSILWSVVQELGQLDDVFPQAARTAIARAMLGGDLLAAYPAVARIARAEPGRAMSIATRLYPLPVLCIFREAFHLPPPPITSGLPAPEKVGPIWGRLLQGTAVVALLFSLFGRSSHFKEPKELHPEPLYYSTAEVGLREVCDPYTRAQEMNWLCFAAQDVVRSILQADCSGAHSRAFALQREVVRFETNPVPGVPPGAPRGLLQAIQRRGHPICGDL